MFCTHPFPKTNHPICISELKHGFCLLVVSGLHWTDTVQNSNRQVEVNKLIRILQSRRSYGCDKYYIYQTVIGIIIGLLVHIELLLVWATMNIVGLLGATPIVIIPLYKMNSPILSVGAI